ncbi:transposase [Streptomyces desertarenae]|uniref:Transposase n=1 Tax=Streptomyces desertarenae TaxID=2666184 RepID=A0ABW4PF45_9ACTN
MTDQHPESEVFAGVDTHTDTHHAVVADPLGRPVADREFPTTTQGYRALLAWLGSFGVVRTIGVECTGSHGAGLTSVLTAAGLMVVEVNVPDRGTRHARGKYDAIDGRAGRVTLKSWRLLRKLRCSTIRTTSLVRAVPCLHLTSSDRGWKTLTATIAENWSRTVTATLSSPVPGTASCIPSGAEGPRGRESYGQRARPAEPISPRLPGTQIRYPRVPIAACPLRAAKKAPVVPLPGRSQTGQQRRTDHPHCAVPPGPPRRRRSDLHDLATSPVPRSYS